MRNNNNQFLLRLDDADKTKIETDCQKLGYTNRSQFIRDLVHNDYLYINLYRELINEVRKQGINLNQVSRYCNQEKQIDEEVLKALSNIATSHTEIIQMIRGVK